MPASSVSAKSSAADRRGICVQYGAPSVLDRVSLQVPTGSVVALLGTNGADKSTLARTNDRHAGLSLRDGDSRIGQVEAVKPPPREVHRGGRQVLGSPNHADQVPNAELSEKTEGLLVPDSSSDRQGERVMCISCAGPTSRLSRRGVLAGAGFAGVAGGLAGSRAAAAPPPTNDRVPRPERDDIFAVVLLGTMGGPPIEPDRAGISTAVVVEGKSYLVDCGRSSATQYVRAGLRHSNLQSIFLTHLHADHVADYYNHFLLGGTAPNTRKDRIEAPVQVFGPGPAGGLPPKFGGGEAPTIGDPPTPGTIKMTNDLINAYAYSTNVFMRDSGVRDVRSLMDVTEIGIPDVGASFENTAPDMAPVVVMEDDRVRVSAILVPHGPVFPAFAFRFDTDHGSVTLSGDTTYSQNLVNIAEQTDLLIHEAVNLDGAQLPEAFRSHVIESHVEVQKVGAIAEAAGARRLVVSHMADLVNGAIEPHRWTKWARTGFSGEVVVGRDLQHFDLKKRKI